MYLYIYIYISSFVSVWVSPIATIEATGCRLEAPCRSEPCWNSHGRVLLSESKSQLLSHIGAPGVLVGGVSSRIKMTEAFPTTKHQPVVQHKASKS